MLSAFHGLCMALADSVPGVSGGTIAFILGFYDDLLRALQGLFNGKGPVRRQSLRALLRFGIGWGVGMAACILALAELFELHVYFMCSLFLGLSAAAFPLVARAERGALRNTARYAPLALLGAALVVGLTLLREDAAVSLRVDFSELRVWPLLYLFVSGAIAVSAMILPGISGSTLLLIAGVYLPAMHALRQLLRLDFSGLPGILALGLGAAAGAALAVRAIRAALRRFRSQMVWLILGLMAGSLYAIVMGPEGSGKTKLLIGALNQAVQRESGSIVCIEKGDTLRFDVDHKVRLIDIKEYAYGGYPFLRGFISGLHAGNFDITHIFIDNLYKLSQDSDPKETENFLDWCSVFSAENSVAFTLTIAGEAKDAPEYIARYMD